MDYTSTLSLFQSVHGWDASLHPFENIFKHVSLRPGSVAILGIVLALFIHWVKNCLGTSPKLAQLPGPWYAPFTTLHLKWGFARGTIWKDVERGHRKYGDIMRLGPRQVWVASKDGVQKILHTIDLPKVTMYAEISRDRNSPGLFGEMYGPELLVGKVLLLIICSRPGPHAKLKRFLGPAFTVTSVDKLDSYFKACTSTLLKCYY